MATIINTAIPDKNTPWENYSGQRVEEWIKAQLDTKAAIFEYKQDTNKYYVFADTTNQALYWSDPETNSGLLIVAFDAPAEYSMAITVTSDVSNAVLIGATGNYIVFTPTVTNRSNNEISENVNITYTFKRGSNTTVVHGTTTTGTQVSLNIDQYLLSGTNTITIQCVGSTTLAGSMASVQYEVVDLILTDTFDISKPVTYGTGTLSIPYTISGSGIKNMEWYIDGTQLAVDNTTDSISYTTVTQTKNIALNAITKKSGGTMTLQEGQHHLQFRAYVTIGGQNFYSKTLYREFVVRKTSSSTLSNPIVLSKGELPSGASNIVASNSWITYNLVQYVPYTFTFAAYNPSSNTTTVQLKVSDSLSTSGLASLPNVATITMTNEVEYPYTYTPMSNGTLYLWAYISSTVGYYFEMSIAETDMDLAEITGNLDFAFDARGRSNDESSHTFSYNNGTTTYNGTFSGFDWNDTSGWNDDSLLIDDGSYFKVETFKPFSSGITTNGYTFEIEFSTEDVSNDDAAVCNMAGVSGGYMNKNGLYISATSAGISCDTWRSNEDLEKHALKVRFKSGEYIRISFVINRMSGGNDDKTAFVYINGRLSGVMAYAASSSFANQTGDTCYLKVQGTSGASVRLRQIRCYSTALNADQILNNYILYRPTLLEMKTVYDRNDIYSNGDTLDFDVLANAMPIMKVTGDLSILENTTNKNDQIQVAEIEYINLQDPTRSFRMTNAAMRPQGTSSMQYPKKNFRIYTSRYDETKLYDYRGNEVERVSGKLLYSFKQGSIPVPTWCLKADYAESSSSHNTGVARIWNKILYDATISYSSSMESGSTVNNAHAFRTHAQEAALANGYQYDVRTCIDGFPIMLFYRATTEQPYIFMGKYNFNNDKSTENVFGFKGIPGFDDEYINGNSGNKYKDCMQCWEVLDSADSIALFNTVTNFDSKWDDAFEARYPDVGDAIQNDTTRFTQLKNFCTWVSSVSQANFADQKWLKLDVFKVAAYYVYLMVFGAVDQTTKNAMLTSEDGIHYYYINYDNDTIFGVRNDGVLAFPPTIDRQSLDTTVTGTTAYAYAGHNNRLWNLCEADKEFMAIVKVVYSSLVSAGLTYANLIDMFDNKQSLAWCERIFNLDADYKYLTPYRSTPPKDNLSMVQGARSSHRRWWLSKRLAIYDAKFVAGEYRGKQFWFRVVDGTTSGKSFTITAGVDFIYCYGINGTPIVDGVSVSAGNTLTFTTDRDLNVGSPINIFGGYYLKGVDLSGLSQYLNDVHIEDIESPSLGNMLETLVIGSSSANSGVTISGLATATKLKTLNLRRCTNITSIDLTHNKNVSTLEARGSSIASITFATGSKISTLNIPTTLTTLELEGCASAVFGNFNYESGNEHGVGINKISFRNCTHSNMKNSWTAVWNWYNSKSSAQKNAIVEYYQDNINWTGFDSTKISNLISMKQALGSKLKIYGKIVLSADIDASTAATLQSLFGQNCFMSTNDLYIQTNSDIVFWSGADEVVEGGENLVLTFNVISSGTGTVGNVSFTRQSGGTHSVTTDWSSANNTLTVTVAETGAADAVYRVLGYFTRGSNVVSANKNITIKKATYPPSTGVTITGPTQITSSSAVYQRDPSTIDGYTGSVTGGWELTGDITNYASIVSGSATNTSVSVGITNNNYFYASGTLTYTLYKHVSGSGATGTALWSVTKTIYLLSSSIAVSTATNQPLMSFLWSKFGQGVSGARPYDSDGHYLQNQEYITKTEAAAFEVDPDHTTSNWSSGYGFVKGTSGTNGFFYSIRTTLTSFSEFKWFTGVTVIPDYFLCNCANMVEFEFHSNVTEIGQYGLAANASGQAASLGLQGELIFPLSLTKLGTRAMSGHSRITKITGNAVEEVRNLAFQACTGVTEIRFPNATSLYERFISGARNLSLIYVPKVTYWQGYSIQDCSANVEHPELVIGSLEAYYNYWNEGFDVKWKLTLSVYCTTFSNILGRTHANFPFTELSVESGNSVFFVSNGCIVDYASNIVRLIPNAESVTLPSGPTTVANGALQALGQLKYLTIPASYTTINHTDGIVGLPNCESIVVDSGNSTFDSRDNCNALVVTSSNEIRIGCKNTTFPSSITSIGIYAFQYCTGLTSVTVPSTVTSIGNGAFNSSGLTTATVNASSYGTSVFHGCGSLTRLDIGAACTSLGSRLAYSAGNLSTIIIRSSSIPSLGTTWNDTPFGVGSYTAGYNTRTSGNNKLYVPSSLISSYQSNTTMTKALLNESYGNFSVVDISTLT